jgi:hypothetical protein
MCRWDIDSVSFRVVTNGKAEIANGAGQVGLHENVLALEIAMSDAWLSGALLTLAAVRLADESPNDVHVQVSQTGCYGERHDDHGPRTHGVRIQKVKERAVLMVVGDEPELSPRSVVLVVGRNKSENVVVAKHRGLVDFGFARPRALLATREYFNCHFLASPTADLRKRRNY